LGVFDQCRKDRKKEGAAKKDGCKGKRPLSKNIDPQKKKKEGEKEMVERRFELQMTVRKKPDALEPV